MKRILALLLCLAMCGTLVACGEGKSEKKPDGTVILEEKDFTVYYTGIETYSNNNMDSYHLCFELEEGKHSEKNVTASLVEVNGVRMHCANMGFMMVQMVDTRISSKKTTKTFMADAISEDQLRVMGIDKITSAKVDITYGDETWCDVEVPVEKKTTTPDYTDKTVVYENDYFRVRYLGKVTDTATIPESKYAGLYIEAIGTEPVLVKDSWIGTYELQEETEEVEESDIIGFEMVDDMNLYSGMGTIVQGVSMMGSYIYLEPGESCYCDSFSFFDAPYYCLEYIVGEGIAKYQQIKDEAVGPYPDYSPLDQYLIQTSAFGLGE